MKAPTLIQSRRHYKISSLTLWDSVTIPLTSGPSPSLCLHKFWLGLLACSPPHTPIQATESCAGAHLRTQTRTPDQEPCSVPESPQPMKDWCVGLHPALLLPWVFVPAWHGSLNMASASDHLSLTIILTLPTSDLHLQPLFIPYRYFLLLSM